MWFYGIIGLTTTEHTCVLVMEVYLCTHCQSHGIEMHQDIYLNHWSLKTEVQTGPAVSAPCVRFLKACSLIQTSPTYVVKKTDTAVTVHDSPVSGSHNGVHKCEPYGMNMKKLKFS